MIHLYRIIFFSLFICNILLSKNPITPKTNSHPSKEINAQQQKKLLHSLYEEEIAFSVLNPDTILLYIQILKENKIILKHTITHQTGFFNNFDIILGIIGVWFGAKWLINNGIDAALLLFLLTHPDHIKATAPSSILPLTEGLVRKRFVALSTSGILTVLSAYILKLSFTVLARGWYKKQNALKDLAKTEELLIQLEKCKNHPDNRLALALF